MRRIQRQHIERNTQEYFIADGLCHATNIIRNECISFINAHYEKYKSYDVTLGNYPGCTKGLVYSLHNLFQIFKSTNFMFRNLFCSKTTKQVFKDVEKSYKGYSEALKDYYKNKHKYKGIPKPPKEKTDRNRYVAKFEAEGQIVTNLNSGYISIGGNKFIIDIPNTLNLKNEYEYFTCKKTGKQKTRLLTEIKEISINPTRNGYEILISYDKNEIIQEKPDNIKYIGIDIGVSSLMAISSNHLDWTPTMINGNKLKKLITSYKRETYHYRKLLGKNKRTSKRIQSILFNFENRKRDYCHKLARQIVNMAIENNISKIVIGNNKFWKQGTNLGKVNNLFQLLPYDTIISLIKEKAEEHGIEVIVREEAYTSKLSFLDLDSFSLTSSPFGKRIKRSIYHSSNYGNIHADINAALNILRKQFGDNIFDITNIKKYKICPKYAEIKLN